MNYVTRLFCSHTIQIGRRRFLSNVVTFSNRNKCTNFIKAMSTFSVIHRDDEKSEMDITTSDDFQELKKVDPTWHGIDSEKSVYEAVKIMVEKQTSSLLITSNDNDIVGIVNERDFITKINPREPLRNDLLIKDIMETKILVVDPTVNSVDALTLMVKKDFRHLTLVNENMESYIKKPYIPREVIKGVMSAKGLLDLYSYEQSLQQVKNAQAEEGREAKKEGDEKESFEKSTLGDLLKKKCSTIKVILNTRVDDKISVSEAIVEMAKHDFGSVIILDNDAKVRGIFTERDYIRKILYKRKDPSKVLVNNYCTRKVHAIDPEASFPDLVYMATHRPFRHFPVVHNEEIAGIISVKDVAREIAKGAESKTGFWLFNLIRSAIEPKKGATPTSTTPTEKGDVNEGKATERKVTENEVPVPDLNTKEVEPTKSEK